MKRFAIKSKYLAVISAISLTSLFGISLMNNSIMQKHSLLQQASSGVGVCFQRVTQSFTALMINDLSSNYLSSEFKSMTSECFSELNSTMSSIVGAKSVLNASNNITSDLHWFNSKMDKIVKLNDGQAIDLSDSNIINKYAELEELKGNIEEGIGKEIASFESIKDLGFVGMILAQLALIASMVSLFFKRKIDAHDFEQLENFSMEAEVSVNQNAKAKRVLEKLFEHIEMPHTEKFVMGYHGAILQENFDLNDKIIKMNTIGYEGSVEDEVHVDELLSTKESVQSEDTTSFNDSLNVVLDRIQDKAFTHGVMIDTDLGENFNVISNHEVLDQVLFNTIQFSMESSLNHNQGRKVVVRSKPLGGIAYCKFKILGHSFSDDELAIINGKEPKSADNVNVNLILLKELIHDANATIAVKNTQQNGIVESEIEMIFERAQIQEVKETPKVNIVKGSKQDIKRFFAQNL